MPNSIIMKKPILYALKTVATDMKRHPDRRALNAEHIHQFKTAEKAPEQTFKAGKSVQKARHRRMSNSQLVISGRKQHTGPCERLQKSDGT